MELLRKLKKGINTDYLTYAQNLGTIPRYKKYLRNGICLLAEFFTNCPIKFKDLKKNLHQKKIMN